MKPRNGTAVSKIVIHVNEFKCVLQSVSPSGSETIFG